MNKIISKRYEFALLFDIKNGNPNGDPDAGNMPRLDFLTNHGRITDVCMKRKAKNYVQLVKEDCAGYKIYVTEGAILNNQHELAYIALDLKPESKKLPKDKEMAQAVTKFMCDNFYDIRTFGAAMSNEVNAGIVRGPVQFCFAESIDPIEPQNLSITRMAVTNEKDEKKERTMGEKWIVPYALYRLEGHISAPLAEKTGFTEEDLELLFEALINMFEHDRSAARGEMTARKLFVFEHNSKLGNARSQELFETIKVSKKDTEKPARKYSDYVVEVDRKNIPNGVKLIEKL